MLSPNKIRDFGDRKSLRLANAYGLSLSFAAHQVR